MNRLFRLFNRQKAPQDIQAPDFLRAGLTPYDAPGPYNAVRQETLYGVLSWIHTAVRILSQTSAGTPFQVSKWAGEKKIAIDNHPFELLLRAPNPLQSRFEFLEATIGFRELTGDAYVWLNRTGPDKPPSEMWILPTDKMRPVPDEKLYLRGYEYSPQSGSAILLDTWEICHLKRFNPLNEFVGMSALESLMTVARGDIAMQAWNTNYFARDHAKPPGALAFSDRINDSDWETMKRDLEKEFGGTQRRMMRLRGAGKGGVQWLNFGVTQKDMEFLQARTFNKEEIFGTLAPGLASMLAVNATEANSIAGKNTFLEMAVWPIHQAVGEKFTSEILPAYGDDLVGEFDDVRVDDRVMKLDEQQASYNVLTVAEAREKYYGLLPLGDVRDLALVSGSELPVEIEAGAAQGAKGEGSEIFGYHIESGVVTKNEVREGLGLPPQDDTDERKLQDAKRRLAVIQAAVSAGLDIGQAIELSGMKGVKPPPALPKMSIQPDLKMGEAFRADLLRWQRKITKRAKADRPIEGITFESDMIPSALRAAIEGALSEVKAIPDIRGIFDDALAWEAYP